MKVIVKHLYDDLYKAEVVLCVGPWKEVRKKLRSYTLDELDTFNETCEGSLSTADYKDKQGRKFRDYIIWVENKKGFYALLHETLHLVRHIFDDRGVPFRSENDESIAYYHMWWFKKLWRTLNGVDKKKNKE